MPMEPAASWMRSHTLGDWRKHGPENLSPSEVQIACRLSHLSVEGDTLEQDFNMGLYTCKIGKVKFFFCAICTSSIIGHENVKREMEYCGVLRFLI